MKKILALVLLAAAGYFFSAGAVWAAEGKMTRAQYKKNLAYNKNALPEGWKYEAGYTLWRMERGLTANRQTYKRYKRDKAWSRNLHRYAREEAVVLDSLDWTVEEVALFWKNYKDLFDFHPAGVEE